MQIWLNNIALSGNTFELPSGVRLNGRQITDGAQFFRATQETIYGRGNKAIELSFTVLKLFSTTADAQAFAYLHWGSIPTAGPLQIACGAPDETARGVALVGAVLEGIELEPLGRSVRINYHFKGGLFTTEDIPLPDPGTNVKRFNLSLSEADEYADVVFDTPFGSAPAAVGAEIAAPAGGYGIDCWPDLSTLTAAGVRFIFGAPIPAAGYHLLGEAVL